MSENTLVLVDGSSYLFRAYHALPALTNSEGHPTGAIYGVVNMLRRLLNEYDPKYLGVIFDSKEKSFRNDLYQPYKANRPEMPEELAQQIKPLFKIIKAMGLPLIIEKGVEADDVIGTLSKQAVKSGMKAVISTGDKDMAQLVNEHITLVNTMTDTKLDIEGVKQKFGVAPEQIIDYLTLIGDTSDNVPGVPKVGPKTATKWLNTYKTLDNLVKHADEITGKVGENLREFIPQIPLTKQLITIKCDVSLHESPKELSPRSQKTDALIQLYQTFEFKKWLRELLETNSHSSHTKTTNKNIQYHTVFTEDELKKLIQQIKNKKLVAFDTETTSLDIFNAEVVGLSFSLNPHEAYYVPLKHIYDNAPKQLDRDKTLQQLKPLLEDANIKIIGQNIKYDMEVLKKYDIYLAGAVFDTMLESYIYNSTATRHDMDSLALKYLNKQCTSYESLCGKGAKQITFDQVEIKKAAYYAAEDADVTLQLHQHLWPRLEKDNTLKTVFETIEMPLVNVIADVEYQGVLVDQDKLKKQSKELEERLCQLREKAFREAGHEFNMNSPKQLQEVLFDKMQLPKLKKTPTGQASTSEDVLQELALNYDLPHLILKYRSLSKLKSTYTDRLPEQIHPKTGRVHTSYHQAITSTGRLSSSDPNLQNIPVRTEEGRRIRQAFIAPKGYQIVAGDYSQVELRIMAHLSGDSGLLEAFKQNQDIHKATASQIFGVSIDNINAEQRRKAKAINFGLIYGMSAFGLSKQINVSRDVAKEYIDMYFHKYPGVKDYMDNTRQKARQRGYVETLFGRRLYVPEINSKNGVRQRAAERMAINAPMQGTAADIIKRAMIDIHQWLKQSHLRAHMIMQVHDELVFEVAQEDIEQLIKKAREFMQNAAKLHVPLLVAFGTGTNWDEAH